MKKQHYYIYKKNDEASIVCLDYDKLPGYRFIPKNNIKYDGIRVNTVVVINPSMIEKVLRRKIKNRLDLYLKLIIETIGNDDDDGAYREALDNLSKYKSIVLHKYKKYLDDKYLEALMKKIAFLEYELNSKIKSYVLDDEEKEVHRRR